MLETAVTREKMKFWLWRPGNRRIKNRWWEPYDWLSLLSSEGFQAMVPLWGWKPRENPADLVIWGSWGTEVTRVWGIEHQRRALLSKNSEDLQRIPLKYWAEHWTTHACEETTQDGEGKPKRIRGESARYILSVGYSACSHQSDWETLWLIQH